MIGRDLDIDARCALLSFAYRTGRRPVSEHERNKAHGETATYQAHRLHSGVRAVVRHRLATRAAAALGSGSTAPEQHWLAPTRASTGLDIARRRVDHSRPGDERLARHSRSTAA